MKGKNLVLTVGLLAACAGAAIAAPQAATPGARLEKPSVRPTRLDPTSITPIYVIDGVEVWGDPIPYNSFNSRVTGHRAVFDQYDGDRNVADDYPPIDNGGPCGAAGFLYAANTDTASSDHFHVRIAHETDDFKGVDTFGVGKNITGVAYLWNQAVSEPLIIIVRALDTFNDTNSATFGAAGARTRTYSGTQVMGVGITYGGGAAVAPGFFYSYVDWTGSIVQPALLDTNGAFNISLHNNTTAQSAASVAPRSQVATWGTRQDELDNTTGLVNPQSTRANSGPQNRYWYLDDSGELGRVSTTHPYSLAGAVANYALTPNGADGGPNESYDTQATLPDVGGCFQNMGPCWALFVQDCQAVDACTLNAPADNATLVPNPPSFDFTPGAVFGTDFACRIYKNGHIYATDTGIVTTSFTLSSAILGGGATPAPAVGQAYQWTMFSNAGTGCPGTETTPYFGFRIAGCWADYNGDGPVDFFDYLDFVGDFSANADAADYNADGVVDFFDYLDFVDAFSGGSGGTGNPNPCLP